MKLVPILLFALWSTGAASDLSYSIVDTAQEDSYDVEQAILYPKEGEAFFGQDAQYIGNAPSYRDNQDGTISDLVTDLMWTKDPGSKQSYETARSGAAACRVGGYSDWRLPTIKELYSLIQLNGSRPSPMSISEDALTPFIDTNFFNFEYGDTQKGERIIDAQFASSTLYAGQTAKGTQTGFGVNFADGRLKGYNLIESMGNEKKFFALYVRGNPNYGVNQFRNNLDGTITDTATGLTWMQTDSGKGMDWPSALKYAEQMEHAGYTDWRLPNAKELQSIIDYSRSPDATESASIAPLFKATAIVNELGMKDYGHYWTSSTYAGKRDARQAIYFAFGRALAYMQDYFSGAGVWVDVHGAGSQLSEPKIGNAAEFPQGLGPGKDVIRIENMVRLVRGGAATLAEQPPEREEDLTLPHRETNEAINRST